MQAGSQFLLPPSAAPPPPTCVITISGQHDAHSQFLPSGCPAFHRALRSSFLSSILSFRHHLSHISCPHFLLFPSCDSFALNYSTSLPRHHHCLSLSLPPPLFVFLSLCVYVDLRVSVSTFASLPLSVSFPLLSPLSLCVFQCLPHLPLASTSHSLTNSSSSAPAPSTTTSSSSSPRKSSSSITSSSASSSSSL